MTPQIRPATADDLIAFYGERPKTSMKAWVAILDGKPIAVGGINYVRGQPFLFSEMKPEMRHYRKTILRAARLFLQTVAPAGLLAVANPEEKGSRRFLEYLGFSHIASHPRGEHYIFEGHR